MPYVKNLRDVRIATLDGHVALVKAREPKFVPASVLPEAFKLGCVECDKDGKLLLDNADPQLPVDEVPTLSEEDRKDPEKRKNALIQAVAKLYTDSDPKNFGQNKLPRAKAVQDLVGFPTSPGEIQGAIEAYHAG